MCHEAVSGRLTWAQEQLPAEGRLGDIACSKDLA